MSKTMKSFFDPDTNQIVLNLTIKLNLETAKDKEKSKIYKNI